MNQKTKETKISLINANAKKENEPVKKSKPSKPEHIEKWNILAISISIFAILIAILSFTGRSTDQFHAINEKIEKIAFEGKLNQAKMSLQLNALEAHSSTVTQSKLRELGSILSYMKENKLKLDPEVARQITIQLDALKDPAL